MLLAISRHLEAQAMAHGEAAAAFVGRDLGDTGPDMGRRFNFCVTYDRALAVRAAAAPMGRIAPR